MELARKARSYGNCPSHAGMARKGDDVGGMEAHRFERKILAAAEDFRVFAAELQAFLNHELLHGAALPVLRQIGNAALRRAGQEGLALRKIDGAPVIRIYHGEFPQLGALINVGHAGAQQTYQRLRERYTGSDLGDVLLELYEVREETIFGGRSQDRGDKLRYRVFIILVGIGPTGK